MRRKVAKYSLYTAILIAGVVVSVVQFYKCLIAALLLSVLGLTAVISLPVYREIIWGWGEEDGTYRSAIVRRPITARNVACTVLIAVSIIATPVIPEMGLSRFYYWLCYAAVALTFVCGGLLLEDNFPKGGREKHP